MNIDDPTFYFDNDRMITIKKNGFNEWVQLDKYITLEKEIELLKEELSIERNERISAIRWITEITRKYSKEYEKPDEEEDEMDNDYSCECCWALHCP